MHGSNIVWSLEDQISQWRQYLMRRQAIHSVDVAELEDHLRQQIAGLTDAGLDQDEAFLVSVKRIGSLDSLSREFAVEHSDRLWKQLVVPSINSDDLGSRSRTDAIVILCLAIAAAVSVRIPALFGLTLDQDPGFYARNLSMFVLPFLTGYFIWKRNYVGEAVRWLVPGFLIAALVVNMYPIVPDSSSEWLVALHLPIALWLLTGIAYAGGHWRNGQGRMDFIRFSGELFIYYVLIAMGGGVLVAFMALIFQSIGIDVEPIFESWILPTGAVGAVLIAAWLVEAKQSVIENMAPVLTRLFTPMFATLLVSFLAVLLWTGRGVDIDRDALIVFDLLLVVVLGLLLYSVSARDSLAAPGFFDLLQVVLLVSALLANFVALFAITDRITEFGFTPNRTAALGMNLVLMVNLAWSAVLYIRFLSGRGPFGHLERWQTKYVPVYAVWAAIVVVVFPPVFGWI